MLAAAPMAKGNRGAGRPKKGGAKVEPPKSDAPTLADVGITKKESSRSQELAKVPPAAVLVSTYSKAQSPLVHPYRVERCEMSCLAANSGRK
jgi:hypothetical protein